MFLVAVNGSTVEFDNIEAAERFAENNGGEVVSAQEIDAFTASLLASGVWK